MKMMMWIIQVGTETESDIETTDYAFSSPDNTIEEQHDVPQRVAALELVSNIENIQVLLEQIVVLQTQDKCKRTIKFPTASNTGLLTFSRVRTLRASSRFCRLVRASPLTSSS
jgi:hypothetical protein